MKLTRRPSGFTLIELLVVISIIAILASLAIPAVTSALTRGQMVQTLNNARQLQIATQTMSLDQFTSGGDGWEWTTPIGAAGTGLSGYFTFLSDNNYLSISDLRKVLGAPGLSIPSTATAGSLTADIIAFTFFQFGEGAPGEQPFVVTRNWSGGALSATEDPYRQKGFILFRKGGEGNFFTRTTDAAEDKVFPEQTGSAAALSTTTLQ